jgi:hypothetical protein
MHETTGEPLDLGGALRAGNHDFRVSPDAGARGYFVDCMLF